MKKVIAFDIGGTKTLGAIVTESGEILERIRVATNPQFGPKNIIGSLFRIIRKFQEQGYQIDAIGIGAAGRININTGVVFYASDNIPNWTNQEIKKLVEQEFKIKTYVDNDCNVAGLGEEWLGAARNSKSYVSLSLGTGVGAAVKVNGKLLHGEHWSGAELGHMTIHPGGRECNCGLFGCLEQYCSGPSLVKTYNEMALEPISTGYEFFDLLNKNNECSRIVIEEFVRNLTYASVSLFNIYDPDLLIIGGGLIDNR